jgi:N-acyl-D-aspartate/D-glutamate deacylase
MAYDLLVKNGRIVDGSGMPAFVGDVAVRHGKIVEIGKLRGAAIGNVALYVQRAYAVAGFTPRAWP